MCVHSCCFIMIFEWFDLKSNFYLTWILPSKLGWKIEKAFFSSFLAFGLVGLLLPVARSSHRPSRPASLAAHSFLSIGCRSPSLHAPWPFLRMAQPSAWPKSAPRHAWPPSAANTPGHLSGAPPPGDTPFILCHVVDHGCDTLVESFVVHSLNIGK